jgi:hypothetical protein
MRGTARVLTDAKNSVQVSQPAGNPKRLAVSFSVPKARQAGVVDHIARQFFGKDFLGLGAGRDSPTRLILWRAMLSQACPCGSPALG